MKPRGIRSVDVVLDEVQRERQTQVAYFDAIDSKAGLVMGFAGALVALSPEPSRLFVDLARAAAVLERHPLPVDVLASALLEYRSTTV